MLNGALEADYGLLMKWTAFLLAGLLTLSVACEKHPVSDLYLIEKKTEGVQPEPKQAQPELETTKPGQTSQ